MSIYQDTTEPWVSFAVIDTDGLPVTGLDNTDFSSAAIVRDSLADTSLSLSAASGPTDHAAGKIHEVGGGYYKVGVATATISSYLGAIQFKATYASGTVLPLRNVVVEPERGTDNANTTTPPTVEAIRGDIDTNSTQLAAIVEDTGTTLPSTLSGIEAKVDTVDGVVDDILVDTGTTLPSTLTSISSAITVVDGIVDDILVDTGTTLPATLSGMETKIDTVDTVVDTLTTSLTGVETKIDTIDGIVDDILVDTGTTLPATLSTIDTEVGQILDRTGYSLTILAGAISNAGNAAEQYDLTIDTVDHRVLYDSLDSSGNRGTTTLSKP